MQAVKQALSLCSSTISRNVTVRSELHTSAILLWKHKKPAQRKTDLPEPIKTSWGRLVSRGMRPREPVTEYTTKPLKVLKTGGRGVTGRIEIRRIGGGLPVVWHMTDRVRITETEPDPKIEVVRDIIPEQTRSAHIALVVGGNKKRWIIATDNMKVGDIVTSTRELPAMPVSPKPGDAHPVGALGIGTQVCCIEKYPYAGSNISNAAGTSATIIKKMGDQVYLRMPSKREMIVDERCLCVAGRVSNTERNKVKLGKAGAKRWLGYRPKSGKWLKKTGLHGRKIKPLPKPRLYDEPEKQEYKLMKLTVDENIFEKCTPLSYNLSK